jgi:hypothetical protein
MSTAWRHSGPNPGRLCCLHHHPPGSRRRPGRGFTAARRRPRRKRRKRRAACPMGRCGWTARLSTRRGAACAPSRWPTTARAPPTALRPRASPPSALAALLSASSSWWWCAAQRRTCRGATRTPPCAPSTARARATRRGPSSCATWGSRRTCTCTTLSGATTASRSAPSSCTGASRRAASGAAPCWVATCCSTSRSPARRAGAQTRD